MSINKDISLTWKGKKYPLKITFGLIDKCEATAELNLVIMAKQNRKGDVRLSQVAKLFAFLFGEAGLELEVETVYEALFGSGDFELEDVKVMIEGIFDAIFPEPKKKDSSSSVKKTKPKPRGRPKKA